MKGKSFRQALFLALAGLLLLSACSAAGKTTAINATAISQGAALQSPTLAQQGNQNSAYPQPANGQEATPYPYPEPDYYPAPTQNPYPYPYPEPEPGNTDSNLVPSATDKAPVEPVNMQDAGLVATDPGKVQLAAGKPQLIEFFAFWDGASIAMAPMLNKLQQSYADKILFSYLDIDNPTNGGFKQALGYKTQPQLFLLDAKGSILKQWQGTVSEDELRAALEACLS
jgi:thiol-disulfide isomerase/thioredoxin